MLVLFATGATVHAAPRKDSSMPAPDVHANQHEANEDSYLSGKVVETMNAGGYSYICIEKHGTKTWVAVPEMKATVGQEMSFIPGQAMPNFTSKTLNRTFDKIVFSGGPVPDRSAGAGNKGKSSKSGSLAMPASGSNASASARADVKVEKATGQNAYTVGEVFEKRAKLHKKTAVVKGKVVKVSAGIMGKNWIHLQDGTGNAQKGTHNLVVTTDDLASVGDVVTIKGTVFKDKDFGSGYKYNVIVENAVVQR